MHPIDIITSPDGRTLARVTQNFRWLVDPTPSPNDDAQEGL